MMHSNNFVLAVKDNGGRVLRELGGGVYLPFHSEYSLYLKNNNNVRASCAVDIDGMDVLGGKELILAANGYVELERFLVDGNLSSGKKFKFVPQGHSDVQDPSSSDNGIIKVTFWKESVIDPNQCFGARTPSGEIKTRGILMDSVAMNSYALPDSACLYSCAISAPVSDGATVAGSDSNQNFTVGTFGMKELSSETVLQLTLLSRKEVLTVKETKHVYCVKCSKKNPFTANNCMKCGTRLAKELITA